MKHLLRPLALGALLAGAAFAQPPAPPKAPDAPKEQPAAKAPADPEQERAALKARLERRISDSEQSIAKMKDALARLSKGEPTDAVQKSIEPWRRGGPEGSGSGPWSGRRPGPHEGGPDAKPDVPDREVVLAFLAEHNPEFAERLKSSVKENPSSADRMIGRLAPHIREVLAERDPEMRDLRIADMKNGWETMGAMRRLIDALRKDPTSRESKEAESGVRNLLGAQFDVQVKLRNREIATLEDRIAQIRKDLADKLAEREGYITQRIKFAQDRAKQPPQRREANESPDASKSTDGPKP